MNSNTETELIARMQRQTHMCKHARTYTHTHTHTFIANTLSLFRQQPFRLDRVPHSVGDCGLVMEIYTYTEQLSMRRYKWTRFVHVGVCEIRRLFSVGTNLLHQSVSISDWDLYVEVRAHLRSKRAGDTDSANTPHTTKHTHGSSPSAAVEWYLTGRCIAGVLYVTILGLRH